MIRIEREIHDQEYDFSYSVSELLWFTEANSKSVTTVKCHICGETAGGVTRLASHMQDEHQTAFKNFVQERRRKYDDLENSAEGEAN